jgi:tRNA-2-methylthio-N6-dimethylallyladenosine synthase
MAVDRTKDGPRRVYLEAFGCQMNALDGELVLSDLDGRGWETAESSDAADLVVFNTCSVRAHAEERVHSRLGQLKGRKERDPGFRIAVMGCMAQRQGEELLRLMPHVDVVCGSQQFPRIAEFLEEVEETGRPVVALDQPGVEGVARNIRVRPERFRAYVAVMRGCHHRCSYCIVPRSRGGKEISRSIPEVTDEVRALADDGVREVTLLGQNINSYGKSLPDRPTLDRLIRAVHEVDGIDRIRFVTSNPMDLERDLLLAMGELPKVMEYLHFPAQSGSDRVLKRMFRGYTKARYIELADLARELVPGIELASDFIVGFPGETEEDFLETVELMERVRFQGSFIFKYSPRPGTKAEGFEDDVPEEVKRERNRRLLQVQERHSFAINQRRIGKRFDVLVEGPSKRNPDRLSGRTRTHQIAAFPGPDELTGEIVTVQVSRVTPLTLIGRIVGPEVPR